MNSVVHQPCVIKVLNLDGSTFGYVQDASRYRLKITPVLTYARVYRRQSDAMKSIQMFSRQIERHYPDKFFRRVRIVYTEGRMID